MLSLHSKINPFTGAGTYYPASDIFLKAYHIITGTDEKVGTVDLEKAFASIWTSGALLSYREREKQSFVEETALFERDIIAGDDEYVFLTVCEPYKRQDAIYSFVFDPFVLIEHGGIVRLEDLGTHYLYIVSRINYGGELWSENQIREFRKKADLVKSVYDLRSRNAIYWLEWIAGLKKIHPLKYIRFKRFFAEVLPYIYVSSDIFNSRIHAVDNAELVFPTMLPLNLLTGVIFRRDYYEIDDFVKYYGLPGTVPDEILPRSYEKWVKKRKGHPIRCPRCDEWMGLPPLALPERPTDKSEVFYTLERSRWERFEGMVCNVCGAVFYVPDPEKVEEDEELTCFDTESFMGELSDFVIVE